LYEQGKRRTIAKQQRMRIVKIVEIVKRKMIFVTTNMYGKFCWCVEKKE
jgi:hypothetical protein